MRWWAAALAAVALVAGCGGGDEPATTAATPPPPSTAARTAPEPASVPDVARSLRRLERRHDARVGVYAVDTGSGRTIAHRANERFAFASTFKALLAGAVLREAGVAGLDRTVPVDELAPAISPVTERRVGTRMSLRALASAAVRFSDNTAANLLLDEVGGPAGLQRVLQALGDDATRIEDREPELNAWRPGQTRNTTTPRAIAGSLRAFVLGDVLGPPERALLTRWLRTNTTGDALIRAGVPDGWVVGDKTGTGGTYGTRNDIAVLWPPRRAPIVLAVLTSRPRPEDEHDDRLLAAVARAVVRALGER